MAVLAALGERYRSVPLDDRGCAVLFPGGSNLRLFRHHELARTLARRYPYQAVRFLKLPESQKPQIVSIAICENDDYRK